MDVKQEYYEFYEHDIKSEAVFVFGQTEEYNALSIKSEKFKNDDEDEPDDKVGIFKSQEVTGQLISVDKFKQEIIECKVSKIEQSDLVSEQVQIFPTNIKQELDNTIKVEATDTSDIKQEVCDYGQFKNENELLNSHCDLPTLKSENNDYPDYLTQSCSSIEDISKNCSEEHPCNISQKSYPSSQSGLNEIDGGCFKQFTAPKRISIHVAIPSKEEFKCDICFKKFCRKFHLQSHLKVHSDEKPFECDVCCKKYKHKRSLQDHILLMHTNDKKPFFKCDICPRQFVRIYSLQLHLSQQHNKKPFKCEVCSKGFYENYELREHFISHKNEKPFKCDICSKEFKRKHSLQKHSIKHGGEKAPEKSLKCAICSQGSSFTSYKSYLIKHSHS